MEFDDFFSSLTNAAIDNQIDELATKKQEKLAETIRLKTSTIDPNYREFNPELYQVIDGDTVRNKQTGELHRISAGEGRFADTFETGLNADGTPNNYYEKNQQRFKAHRDEYARLLGKSPDDISETDLYEAGRAQKQSFQENLGNLKGQGFRLGEKDVYGRQVMNFDNPDAIGSILNSEGMNAGYSSKYNWRQLQEDRLSGRREMSKKQARDPLRWATDQVVGAVGTVGDFGIDAAILTSTILPFNNKKFDILGGNSITELLVRGKEEGWNKLRDGLTSEQKLYMERMREKQSSYIQDPLYRSRKEQYMKAGDTEAMAAFKSWGQGAGDTLEHFIENPTQIVDTSIESLPYMIGSGLVASAFTKGTMQRMIANGATKGAWTKAELAAIQKVATGASIGFTAVTEGLGNGVSAYQKVMSLDEQGLANSEKYQALLAKGVAPEEAQQIVAEEAAWRTFVISGFVAGVANKLTGAGKIEANLFRRLDDIAVKNGGKDIAGKLAKTLKGTYAVSEGALKEGAEEFIQSGGGEAIAQSQAASVTDNPDLINPAASAEAAGAGVVAGMATGGVASNTSRIAKGAAKGVVKGVELGVKGVNKLKSTNTTAQAVTDNEIKASDDINKLKVHENSKVLGGTSSTAGRALAAIDKAAGGQTASNAASALDTVIGRAEKGEKILVNEAKFLLRRFVARVGENATPEQKAQIDAYQTKVDKMSQAFSESLSNRISTVAQSIQDMTKDGKGDSAEANTLWDEYASLAKAGEAYNVDAQKIFKAMTGVDSMDSMPEAIQTEIRQYRTTEALMGELTRTVETANTGQKTMQRVAGEVLVGGGKKKAVRDYVELMQEAVTNRNFGDFKRNLEEMTSFVKFKEKQTRVLGKFLANMEAGMSEQEALAKAQADSNAKANKHFKFYFDKEGTSRLYFQMKRELDLMEATRQSLLGEWNTSGAPAQKSKAGKMANKEIAAYAEWADNEEIDFAAIENFVETATGESIDEARKNAIQVAKDKAIRDKAKAKEAANAARRVALDHRHYKESKYNPKNYLVKEKGAYNPVKTLKNILERYRKTGNAAEVLNALGLFQTMVKKGELQPQFLDAVRKRLRAEILSEGLIWPTQTDRRAWLAEQNKGDKKEGKPTAPAQPKGDAKAESKEATEEPTQDGAVASTDNESLFEQIKALFSYMGDSAEFIKKFGWTVPTPEVLQQVVDIIDGRPVVYPAAGLGLWGKLLQNVGIEVAVSDLNPGINSYDPKAGVKPFTSIKQQSAKSAIAGAPAGSVLLLVWPEMQGDNFIAEALAEFKGDTIIFIGTPPGGIHTLSDAAFEALETWKMDVVEDLDNFHTVDNQERLITFKKQIKKEEAIDVEINEQVAQIFEWINEIFGKDILKFVDVYATEPVADYPYLRSGFYNRETKRVGLIADQIFNRVATPGVTPKAWLTWVIFHEVGHKAVKALFGEAAADGLKAYEVALQQAYDNSPMLQELADAVANLKWKMNYSELTDSRQKMSAIEEAVVETVAALQVNDMNPEKALFALEVQWNLDGFTELYLDKFSSQSSLKKTLDAIQNVFNKLLAAIGIISPNVTKGNVEHFFMSIAAKQMEFISPQSKVTRSIPSMDDLRALSALSEADLRAFYDKVDKKSSLADTLRSLLAIEEIFSDPVEEELEEDPFVGLDEQDIPDWTVEDVPIDEEDPFLTYAPEGNEGTWDDVDVNEEGDKLPPREVPLIIVEDVDGKTEKLTLEEAKARYIEVQRELANAAEDGGDIELEYEARQLNDGIKIAENFTPVPDVTPRPEKTPVKAETKEEKEKPKPFTDAQLFNIRMAMDFLEQVISGELDIPAHQVTMPTQAAARVWFNELERARNQGLDPTAREMAEWMMGFYEAQLASREQTAEKIRAKNTNDSREIVSLGEKIKSGESLPVATQSMLDRTVDFLSEKIMPFIWKLARHPETNHRWTRNEAMADLENNGGKALRKDLAHQFKLKGIPVWGKTFIRVAQDATTNLLNQSINVFDTIADYGVRKSVFKKLGLDEKEQMGMHTIARFVLEFQKKFDEIHLGLLNEVGLDQQINTPLRGDEKVDATGAAIFNPLFKYAMQYLYDEEGKLNPNAIATMALEVGSWLTSAAANALNNDESTQKSLYGMGEEQSFPLDYALSRLLQNAVRQGTLKSEAARQIGQRIVRAMNIKVGGRNVNPTIQANLEISIGEMALAVATEMQLIESREVPASWRNAARDIELTYDEFYDTYSDEGEQMVLLMPRSEAYLGVVNDKKNSKEDRKAARADWDMSNFRESLNNKHLRTAFMGARKVLEQYFSNRSYVREPGFEVQEAPTHRARTNSRIPKKQRLAMAVMNARKWLPIKGAFRLLNIIPENSMLTVNGGHSQADIDNALDVQKDAMLSKNATILRAVEHAKNWVGDNGTKVFHFAYKMISTGRLYIDSNTINPQADKLHRFLFGMVGWDMEISTALNPTGKLAKATQLFKMSVAVALDIKFGSIGPDGISLAKLEQMVDDKMSTPLAKRAMTAILEAERTNTQLSEALLEELRREGYLAENFHSLLAIREYARYRAAKGNSIKVNLPLEIDGKTNGIAIGALQTPFTSILSRAKEDEGSSAETFFNILAATGIFVADMGADTYAEWREDAGTMDNYEGLAYDAKKVVDMLVEEGWLSDKEAKFIKDEGLKARIKKARSNVARASIEAGFLTLTRKLAKSPLMVASYNAGIASIKRALQKVALEEYYTRLSSIRVNRTDDTAADYDELLRQLMDVVMDMGRIIYAGSEREFQQSKDGVEITRKVRDARLDPYSAAFEKSRWGNRKAKEAALREAFPTFEELDAYRKSNEGLNPAARPDPDGYDIIDFRGELAGFNIVISATFGRGIQVGIENRLGPMKEVRSALNNGVMLMNMIAKNYYERMVVQMTKSLGRNLTPNEMELIARNMQKKGWIPSVRTAEADNLDEYLELHDEADQIILGPTGEPVSARASFRKRLALKTVSFLKSGFLGTPRGQVHSGSSLFGFGMGLNLGVRALVKSIHSSDGSVMTRILGEENANYLGVHDAIVGNPLDLLDAAVTSNMHFIDVQSEWDLGSEVQKSLSRFMQLMTDPLHFTDKDRSAVMYAFDDIISKFWEGYDKEGTVEDNFNSFIADFDGLVERNTEARVELFKLLTNGSINQFAIDEGNYSIGQSLSSIIAKIETTDSAWKVMSNREGLRLSEEVQAAILDIAFNRLEGNPLKVFVDYLAGQNREGVNFSDALDVVWGAFNTLVRQDEKNRSRDRLREAINVLKGSSVMVVNGESIPLRVEVDADNRGIGTEYRKSTHTIILRPGDNIEDVLGDLLRYGMIASTAAKLSELYADPKDRALVIKQILSRAVKWANEKGQDKGKARARELVVALAGAPNRASTQLKLITEYLSNIQGSLKETAQGLAFDFDGKQVQQSLNDMMKIMAEGKDKVVFFSSPRGVNQSRFDGIEGRTLTYDTVKELLATFSQTDNLTEEEQIFLDGAAKLLEKGLLGIDELLLKMVDGQIDQLNEGEYVDENSTILLETTDNILSSPVGMSKQEVLLHEIFHPLLKLVTQHSNLKDRLREIYDLAVAEVDAGRLTWRIFLPQTPGIDPQLDETLAKERFAHIFDLKRNPDGTFNKAEHEIRYHEFFAIAMTNKVFGDALRKIPTRGDKYTFWQNNLFTTITAAIAEAFRWLLGAARRDNKNLKEALDHLAQDVMAANRRHQKLAKKAQDSGPIQGAMNWMDRKILERFSSLNAAKLQEWARKNALNYQDIKKELDSKDSQLSKLFAAAKSATASVLDERMDMEEFRNALESAMLNYNKNGTVYQLLQELLPWADRNNRFVDLLRRSNVLIDANRQKIIETMKGTMKDIFDPFRRLTDPERSALSKVILRTDLSALLDAGLDATGIMDLLFDKNKVIERITATLTTMEQVVNNPWLMERFNLQSRSLAHLMIHGTPLTGVPHSEYNAYNIVKTQAYLEADQKVEFDPETEAQLIQLMDELTTLRAILELPQKTLDVARGVVEHEMARPTDVNGFSGTLALARNHKIVSLEKNFRGNPTQVWKGYVYETFDEDIDVKFVADTPFNELALTNDGYRKVQTLPASKLLPDIDVKFKNVAIYVSKSKGVNTYSKSMINLTSEQKHGFGMFDLHLTVDEWNDKAPGKSAAQVISLVEELDYNAQYEFDRAVRGGKVDAGAPLIPLYNEDGKVVDMRYVMSEEHKVKYLGKREYIDEILPRMMGAIDDRSNTPVINHEIVDMLYQEWQKYRNDKDHRFLMVGSREKGKDHRSTIALKNDLVKARIEKKQAADANDTFKEQMLDRRIKSLKDRIASQEMWDLLPKETQLYAEQLFGGKFMVVRDEMYNMVFGFRKLAFANNKWLGKTAPFVRIVEKIWQEVIQWERFRIAVLQPSVVIGNMISNTFVLLAHGVPPQYIWRYFNEAVLGMRAYQKNLTNAQKLKHQIAINQQYGKPVAALEAKLSRLEELIETSEVHEIVEEGLFTSIVEEFGGDEQSYRRRLTNKLLDKVGVVSGSQSAVKLAQEVYMVPGSQMARFALMGTQYGDFVARYIKLKWDKDVKKVPHEKAIREALDTFIYYNIPQNKYLQWMNDNGLFMFTKFFFRIQHIAFRLFQRSPTRAAAAFAFQAQYEHTVLGDSVGGYLGDVARMFKKFDPTPFDNVTDGDIFDPSLFKWMGIFFGD